ncbi:MAG: hypothetical protein ACKOWE_06690 [Micrococcales bacterium]
MALIKTQKIVYLKVNDAEYSLFEKKVRDALEIFPTCRIIAINTHNMLWGAHVWVTIDLDGEV